MPKDYIEIEESDIGVIYYSKINSNFAVVPYGESIYDEEKFLSQCGLFAESECANN